MSIPPQPAIISRAKSWSNLDPNSTTASYVNKLIGCADSSDEDGNTDNNRDEITAARAELTKLFPSDDKTSRIGFGTAGLRSQMKPGPCGMNDLVIIQTSQGLAKYCQSHPSNVGKKDELTVVIGYDHRCNPKLNLSSHTFALLTTLVFRQAGYHCLLLDGYVPTPLVSFATTKLNAAVGIMITASHNPKDDAGYKVYWKDGCQIRPPYDIEISNCILDELTPWVDYGSIVTNLRKEITESDGTDDPCLGLSDREGTERMMDEYYNAIRCSGLITDQSKLLSETNWIPPKVVYTAMHGVGHPFAIRSYETFQLHPFLSVSQQQDPDPNFPTVSFPNPEEKGALDIAMLHADEHGCDVILANDPDADRLAVAECDRESGKWTVFTGDQIGTMLGCWLWEQVGKFCDKKVAMVASTVSSSMLAAIADTEGFHFEETLTGFKWIGSKAKALSEEEGYRALFAYEEAIGFSCGCDTVVPDKDGVSALGVITELAYHVYHQGSNLARYMQGLYDKYGVFVSNNGYYYCYDPAIVANIIEGMRNDGKYMSRVGEFEVASIRDLGEPGYDTNTPDHKPTLPRSKSSPMITIRFKNGCRVHFRASGTEPKFKYYIEMRGRPGVRRDLVVKTLHTMSNVILEELLKPKENGLVDPNEGVASKM